VTGVQVDLTGTGTDSEDGALVGVALQWNSSLDGSLGSGVSVSTTTLSVGVHTITLNVTDSDGAADATTINVTITSS
jgi:hypothetical protein